MWADGGWNQTPPKKEIDQTTQENGAQGLDNPWWNCVVDLDNSQSKIFALELDNSN